MTYDPRAPNPSTRDSTGHLAAVQPLDAALRLEGLKTLRWLAPLLVVVVTTVVFLPALENGFVAWDDGTAFLENPHYRGLGPTQLRWMWTTLSTAMYRPLTWMTYGADFLLWGMEPRGYHLTSLLLHVANALLFYFVARRLLALSMPAARGAGLSIAAALAAALFAVHPLRVEAVAWVSARADLLSGLFLLLSILAYLGFASRPPSTPGRGAWLATAAALYALSLLAKPVALPFALVLVTLDVYPLRRLGGGTGRWFGPSVRPVWWEKLPFLVLAVAIAPLVFSAKASAGLLTVTGSKPLLAMALTVYGLAFHLWKMLLPLDLSPMYEMPPVVVALGWRFGLAASALVAITGLLVAFRRRFPGALAAWVCYVVFLAPTSGIIPYGAQMAADRYTYLASMGWSIVAAGGVLALADAWRSRHIGVPARVAVAALALAAVVWLGALAWKQNDVWRDSERLWSYTVAVTPDASYAHNNLANVLVEQGRLEEAATHLKEAVRLDFRSGVQRMNLAHILVALGRDEEGLYHLERAVELMPDKAAGYNEMGTALLTNGRLDDARKQFEKALRISPSNAEPHNNIGIILVQQGKVEEAVERFLSAVELQPAFADAHNNLANALMSLGRWDEATAAYGRAVESNPESAYIHVNFADALVALERLDEAADHYQRAITVEPEHARAHHNLGIVRLRQARFVEAAEVFKRALEIDPDLSDARVNLEAALARSRP